MPQLPAYSPAMKVAKTDLVRALQLRYDHYSAQGVFESACAKAGLDDQQSHFDRVQVAAFRTALARVGDRLQRVNERLEALLGEGASSAAEAKPAQAPQATAPMPPPEVASAPAPEPERPAQAPQSTAPPPPVEAEKPEAKGKAKKSEPKTTRIVLKDFDLAKGEQVLVCGDLRELGNWDPEHARPLAKDGDVYTTTIELTNGDAGAFKFLRRTADGTFKWEGGENRDLEPVAKIEASWQS
jgi:hypothetical protein